jgi:hypothetical protein
MKRLIGRSDVEDALKKLDKLTDEEVRMAVAQNLKATHNVDQRVRGIANTVVAVGDRVAGVDDRVAAVDVKVTSVDDTVKNVGDKVAEVIHGAQKYLHRSPMRYLTPKLLRWKGSEDGYPTSCQRPRSNQTFVIS